MMFRKLSLLLVLFSVTGLSSAQAIDISPLGIGAISNYASRPELNDVSAGLSLGLGGLIGYDFTEMFGVETGFFYVPRQFDYVEQSSKVTTAQTFIEIPVMFRVKPISIVVLEVGPYVGFGTLTELSVNGIRINSQYMKPKTDIGVKAGAGVIVPVARDMKVRLEGIYSHGFKNVCEGRVELRARNFDILAGLTFDI